MEGGGLEGDPDTQRPSALEVFTVLMAAARMEGDG